jgi:hypothetical protein
MNRVSLPLAFVRGFEPPIRPQPVMNAMTYPRGDATGIESLRFG